MRSAGPALAPAGVRRLHERRAPAGAREVGFERRQRVGIAPVAPVLGDGEQLRERTPDLIRQAALGFGLELRRRVRPRERPGPNVGLSRRRASAQKDHAREREVLRRGGGRPVGRPAPAKIPPVRLRPRPAAAPGSSRTHQVCGILWGEAVQAVIIA